MPGCIVSPSEERILRRGARGVEASACGQRFGKWSMLDVFLVSILMALANDQFWIEGTPQPGLMCFALAIVASMLTSRHMLARVGESALQSSSPLRHPLRLALWQAALLIPVGVKVVAASSVLIMRCSAPRRGRG